MKLKTMKKLLVQTGTLKTAMKQAVKGIYKNSPLPMLDYFYCRAMGDKLRITASNLNETVSVTIRCEMRDEMEFLFPSSDLKFIEKLENDSIITFYVNGKYVELATDSEKLINDAKEVDDYPRIPICNIRVATMHGDFLSELKTSLKYVGSDGLRPMLNTVFIEATSGETYKMVASDAVRIRAVDLQGQMQFINEKDRHDNYKSSYLLPLSFCKLLTNYKNADKITLSVNKEKTTASVSFVDNDIYEIEIIGSLCEMEFVNYKQCIPDNHPIKATFKKDALLKVIDKGSTVANRVNHQGLFILNGETKLLVENPDAGKEYTAYLNCEHTGDNIEIAFNLNLLSDTVKDIQGETVTVEMSNDSNAAIMREKNTTMLLMTITP